MYQCLAAIDIGSNTVHLVVAAMNGQQLTVLADDSIFVRLADGVWNLGYIPDERILSTNHALLHLRGIARSLGAQRIDVVATEVARTARNTAALLSAIEATTGLKPLVLSGMDEALLTFRGVTHGRHLPSTVAVADLGGGSLEVIIAELGNGTWRTSLPIGSAFMHDRFAPHDPPLSGEAAALETYLAETLSSIPKLNHVEGIIVTGGTVNALMRLVQQAQGRASGDRVLRRSDLDHAIHLMLAKPAAIIAADYRLRVERARLLPTGAIILAALIDHLHLPGILVSQAGIREGVLLAAAMYGDGWLEGVRAEAYPNTLLPEEQSRHISVPPLEIPQPITTHLDLPPLAWKPTAAVAWEMLNEQVESMLSYRQAVHDGDVEAVHDMRVVARRMRTVVDTFAPCFPSRETRRLRRAIKGIAQTLGGVRDADVALERLHAQVAEADPNLIPGLQVMIAQQAKARHRARRTLKAYLTAKRSNEVRELVAKLRFEPGNVISPTVVRSTAIPPILAKEVVHE